MVDGEDIRAVANLLNFNIQLILVTHIEMFSLAPIATTPFVEGKGKTRNLDRRGSS